MGDRAMAEIKKEGGSLYVYTHWGGFELAKDAKEAVKSAQGRLSDYSYATRIIVDQLTKQGRDEETGYGLMLEPNAEDEYNNDKPSVTIDLLNETLTVNKDGQEEGFTFKEILEQPTDEA